MTNYEYLKYMINNQKAVELFFCRMIEDVAGEEYCDHICPMADICGRGHPGFAEWLKKEHHQPMADRGLKP